MPRGAEIHCNFPVQCCKSCQKRYPGCHGTCEQYKAESEQCKIKRKWLKEQNDTTLTSKVYDKHISTKIEFPHKRNRS